MSSENRALAVRYFEELCNARKLSVADEIFSADHIHHDPSSLGWDPGRSR